ncbi:MAG: 2-dehydro-3-deoxyglucarate aldolase, partial [Burkholderiales bacterium]|nr:2-dehydro-3-deoxyglucarate aldolase [Burkholderiales bacterium]
AVFLQIESREGVDDAEAIAATPGVDCLWVGHVDLSCALGEPGRFDTPAFTSAIARVIEASRRAGIRTGRVAPTADECAALAAAGYDCLALGTDTQTFQAALSRGIADLRARLGNAS